MIKIVPYLFLLGALLAAIACLGRADYNLPVFLFAYIAWMYMHVFQQEPKNECYSVVYIFFIIAWKTWFDPAYERLAPWEHKLHVMTVWLVCINFVLKIISIILSFVFEPKVKNSFQKTYKDTMKNFQKGNNY